MKHIKIAAGLAHINYGKLTQLVKEAEAAGLYNLKGHRTVGGMRASIYNAMPLEGVKKLVAFMDDFEAKHK